MVDPEEYLEDEDEWEEQAFLEGMEEAELNEDELRKKKEPFMSEFEEFEELEEALEKAFPDEE